MPSWPKEPILPGKKGSIKVKYDTNRLGIISKVISVTSNAKNSTVVLTLKGNIIEPPAETAPEKAVNTQTTPLPK